jgi:hypothetical protein
VKDVSIAIQVHFDVLSAGCHGCEDDTSLLMKMTRETRRCFIGTWSSSPHLYLLDHGGSMMHVTVFVTRSRTRGECIPTRKELEEEQKKAFENTSFDLFCGLAKDETDPPETLTSIVAANTAAYCLPGQTEFCFHFALRKLSVQRNFH